MKFGTDLPDSYSRDRERFYMQLSDSDDDDKPERQPNPRRSGTGGGAGGGGGGGAGGKKKTSGGAGAGAAGKVEIKFKHERPVIRERPLSAKMFHNVSANDAELKVGKKKWMKLLGRLSHSFNYDGRMLRVLSLPYIFRCQVVII